MDKNIYDFTKNEEIAYNTIPVFVADNYEWSMMQHINTTVLYKNSRYISGNSEDKPFKNIMRPILNLQYRAEGFDLKDIVMYVDDSEKYFMSFLVSKYHEKWARENKIDVFISDMVKSFVDFGGILVKNVFKEKPEVVKFQSIAFCDQTDLMSGPIGIKHYLSPSQMMKMKKRNWGNKKYGATIMIDELITLAENDKKDHKPSQLKSRTPGKYLEIYEVHGSFPKDWLEYKDNSAAEVYPTNPETHQPDIEYSDQMHIITLLKKPDGSRSGETLFCGPETDPIFKFLSRDEIYGRALGLGGAEELFEPQVWTNWNVIRMKGMLEAASKIIYQTADSAFANRNKTDQVENGEILITAPDTRIEQINTQPVNLPAFDNAVKEWEMHGQNLGAANDVSLGKQPASGTPFDLQKLITQEANSLHEMRKGDIAVFLDEVYRDWIIPHLVKEIKKDQEWMDELDLDEMTAIADNLVIIEANKMMTERVLNGMQIDPAMVDQYKQQVRQEFMKGGNKKFLQILDGELEDAPIALKIDIAGKQKDLPSITDKLTNVFKEIISNPSVLDDPRAAKIFNKILEYSGLSPIDFYQPAQPQQNDEKKEQKVSESISFKDLPPEAQVQMAAQAGIKMQPPAPQPATAPLTR